MNNIKGILKITELKAVTQPSNSIGKILPKVIFDYVLFRITWVLVPYL